MTGAALAGTIENRTGGVDMGGRRLGRMGFAAVGIALLHGCAAILPAGDRVEYCRVALEDRVDSVVVEPHDLRHLARAEVVAEGVLAGALLDPRSRGSLLVPPPHPFLWVPGIVLGAVAGFVLHERCRAELLRVPDAEADFERIVQTVDVAGSLKRSVLVELDAQRPKCAAVRKDESIEAAPDAVIELTKLAFVLGCGTRRNAYGVTLDWRVVKRRPDGAESVHGPKTTLYIQNSSLPVEHWLASPDRARLEIERVMAKIAHWFVRQLTGHYGPNWTPPTLRVPFPESEPPTPANASGD